jgi:transposase
MDLEAHQAVFAWVLRVVAREGLLRGKTLGIDATTLEANAALRSIVRRDSGESYQEFLTALATASGIETPTREDLAKIDRDRPGKGSNGDWTNPNDPDAKITKMKDGRTHMAHKAEHAVDMETGAVVAVTTQPADRGDTQSIHVTTQEALDTLADVLEDPEAADQVSDELLAEIVADKGYHSNAVLTEYQKLGIRTYISEPKRGRRNWRKNLEAKKATYGNRRRVRGERGKALLRKRGERVERSFAHCYETGAMRRTHLRGHQNIHKRQLIHVAASNLGLVMRQRFGLGAPRGLQGRLLAALASLRALLPLLRGCFRALDALSARQIRRSITTRFEGFACRAA